VDPRDHSRAGCLAAAASVVPGHPWIATAAHHRPRRCDMAIFFVNVDDVMMSMVKWGFNSINGDYPLMVF